MCNKPKENRENSLNKPFFLIFGASTLRSLANATFLVESRHTCDHLVDASIKTILEWAIVWAYRSDRYHLEFFPMTPHLG